MIIEPKHFEYLVIQRGEVAHERKNFEKWKVAYEASLGSILNQIAPALPKVCRRIVDVGSGLGGIDVLLRERYGEDLERIWLVDGENDPPEVVASYKTFNNAKVAKDFHFKNGAAPGLVDVVQNIPNVKVDLFVSFAAYGFHIHPGNYLDDIVAASHKDTTLIFDVRRTKDAWLQLLVEAFGTPRVLHRAEKYVRLAFRGRQES